MARLLLLVAATLSLLLLIAPSSIDGRSVKKVLTRGGRGYELADDTKSLPREVYLIHRANQRAMGHLPPMTTTPQKLGDYIIETPNATVTTSTTTTTTSTPIDTTVLLTPGSILQSMAAKRPIPASVVAVILGVIPKDSVNVTLAYPNGDAILTPVDQQRANAAAAVIMTIDPKKVAVPPSTPPTLTPTMILQTMAAGNPLPRAVVQEIMRHIPARSVNIMVTSPQGDAIITPTTQSNANDAAAAIVKIDPALVAFPAIPAPVLVDQIRSMQLASYQFALEQETKRRKAFEKAGLSWPPPPPTLPPPMKANQIAAQTAAAANAAKAASIALPSNTDLAAKAKEAEKAAANAAAIANAANTAQAARDANDAAARAAASIPATSGTQTNMISNPAAANAAYAAANAAAAAAVATAATNTSNPIFAESANKALVANMTAFAIADAANKAAAAATANAAAATALASLPPQATLSLVPQAQLSTLDPLTQATLAQFEQPSNSPLAQALRHQWEAIRPAVINAASNSADPALRDLAQRAYNEALRAGLIHPPQAQVYDAALKGVALTPVNPPAASGHAPIDLPVKPVSVTSPVPILVSPTPGSPAPMWPQAAQPAASAPPAPIPTLPPPVMPVPPIQPQLPQQPQPAAVGIVGKKKKKGGLKGLFSKIGKKAKSAMNKIKGLKGRVKRK